MAVINPSSSADFSRQPDSGSPDFLRWRFPVVNVGDTTLPLAFPQHADVCVQAADTGLGWGGSTLTIQGTIDEVDWFTVAKADGSGAGTLTDDGGFTVLDRPWKIRASVSGGSGIIKVLFSFRKQPKG